jgi:hypothetical protein
MRMSGPCTDAEQIVHCFGKEKVLGKTGLHDTDAWARLSGCDEGETRNADYGTVGDRYIPPSADIDLLDDVAEEEPVPRRCRTFSLSRTE